MRRQGLQPQQPSSHMTTSWRQPGQPHSIHGVAHNVQDQLTRRPFGISRRQAFDEQTHSLDNLSGDTQSQQLSQPVQLPVISAQSIPRDRFALLEENVKQPYSDASLHCSTIENPILSGDKRQFDHGSIKDIPLVPYPDQKDSFSQNSERIGNHSYSALDRQCSRDLPDFDTNQRYSGNHVSQKVMLQRKFYNEWFVLRKIHDIFEYMKWKNQWFQRESQAIKHLKMFNLCLVHDILRPSAKTLSLDPNRSRIEIDKYLKRSGDLKKALSHLEFFTKEDACAQELKQRLMSYEPTIYAVKQQEDWLSSTVWNKLPVEVSNYLIQEKDDAYNLKIANTVFELFISKMQSKLYYDIGMFACS